MSADRADIRELLPLYALGVLEDNEATWVEAAIANNPTLAIELAAYQDTASGLIDLNAGPVTPDPEVKARLMASIGESRFEKFTARLAQLFDVTVDRARELLGLMERKASWEHAMPGLGLVHFDGGPAYAAADCGFVRLAPGTSFPHHTHMGEEVSLILAGAIQDKQTGVIYRAGDEVVRPLDSDHDVVSVGDEDAIYAARAMNGIAIAGAPARPSRS
ncbi:MAG: cupin domain-containing protein [Kofleriaceae bacterium]